MSIIYINPYQFAAAYDPDAQSYITAVETADGQALEVGVKDAINAFVVGCKSDGIWNAIKASCILAGARTLAGALVPLAGAAPTNVGGNFVAADYNRETGLVGDGSTKYLDSNRNNNADPQNNNHNAVYVSAVLTNAVTSHVYMGVGPITNESGSNNIIYTFIQQNPGPRHAFRNRTSSELNTLGSPVIGLIGTSRDNSADYTYRLSGSSTVASKTSQTPRSANVIVFATEGGNAPTNARLAFYSIGESLDLALLDARVTTLMSDLTAAIP